MLRLIKYIRMWLMRWRIRRYESTLSDSSVTIERLLGYLAIIDIPLLDVVPLSYRRQVEVNTYYRATQLTSILENALKCLEHNQSNPDNEWYPEKSLLVTDGLTKHNLNGIFTDKSNNIAVEVFIPQTLNLLQAINAHFKQLDEMDHDFYLRRLKWVILDLYEIIAAVTYCTVSYHESRSTRTTE